MSQYVIHSPTRTPCFCGQKLFNYVWELTGDASIALEHSLNVCLTALKCVEVADKDPGVYRLGILRIGLVPHLTHLHSAFGRHCPVCLQQSVQQHITIPSGYEDCNQLFSNTSPYHLDARIATRYSVTHHRTIWMQGLQPIVQ
jgi:hypothetical protein